MFANAGVQQHKRPDPHHLLLPATIHVPYGHVGKTKELLTHSCVAPGAWAMQAFGQDRDVVVLVGVDVVVVVVVVVAVSTVGSVMFGVAQQQNWLGPQSVEPEALHVPDGQVEDPGTQVLK